MKKGPKPAKDPTVVDAWTFLPEVYRVLARITRNCDELEDLAQDVYLSLLLWTRARNVMINPERLVKQIARNRAIDWYRAQRQAFVDYVDPTEIDSVIDTDSEIEHTVNTAQELDELRRALKSLPARTREAYVMRKIWGWSQKDIANQLRISEHGVEALITNGSRRLREYASALRRSSTHGVPSVLLERPSRRKVAA